MPIPRVHGLDELPARDPHAPERQQPRAVCSSCGPPRHPGGRARKQRTADRCGSFEIIRRARGATLGTLRGARAARGATQAFTSGRLNLPPAHRRPACHRPAAKCRESAASLQSFASSALLSTSAPPSIAVMFLLGWKLNATRSPQAPILQPRQLEPIARGILDDPQTVFARKVVRAIHVHQQAGRNALVSRGWPA